MRLWADDGGTPAGFWATVATVALAVIGAAVVIFRIQNARISALEKERVAFRAEKRKDVVELLDKVEELHASQVECERREAKLIARLEILERNRGQP